MSKTVNTIAIFSNNCSQISGVFGLSLLIDKSLKY